MPMSLNGASLPAAATLPVPLVEVTFFSRFVIARLLSRVCVVDGVAAACKARRIRARGWNMLMIGCVG